MNSAPTAAPTPAFEVWTAWRCMNIPASVVGPVLRVYRATAPTARTSMRWGIRELGPEMGEEPGKELRVQQGGTMPERRLGSGISTARSRGLHSVIPESSQGFGILFPFGCSAHWQIPASQALDASTLYPASTARPVPLATRAHAFPVWALTMPGPANRSECGQSLWAALGDLWVTERGCPAPSPGESI